MTWADCGGAGSRLGNAVRAGIRREASARDETCISALRQQMRTGRRVCPMCVLGCLRFELDTRPTLDRPSSAMTSPLARMLHE